MSMGWNGRESLPGKDHPDLVSTLVSVQTLKGEAEQLEALNRLPEAKKAMMEAMEKLIVIRPSLTEDSDKACVDGVLRGLVEDAERVQLLLRLDKLSHAWEQEKAVARSTSDKASESVAEGHKDLMDLLPAPPSEFKTVEDGVVLQMGVESMTKDENLGEEESSSPSEVVAGDKDVTEESMLSGPKGSVSFNLSESDEGRDEVTEGRGSWVAPKPERAVSRTSDVSICASSMDEVGSVVSYSSEMAPLVIEPAGAPRQGGSRFTVEVSAEGGIQLEGIAYLKIGGRPCAEVAALEKTQRQFLAPMTRGLPGPADVLVVMEDASESLLLRAAFEYYDKMEIVDATPRSLAYGRKNKVQVTVLNLVGNSLVGVEVRLGEKRVDSEIVTVTGRAVPKGDPPCTEIGLAIAPIERGRSRECLSVKVLGKAGNVVEAIDYLRLYRPMVFESRVKGSRVKLEEEDTVAMRKSGINNAVVFSKDPIQKLPPTASLPSGGLYYSITIIKTATAMKTFALGLTTIDPSNVTNLPSSRVQEDAIATLAPKVEGPCSLLIGYDPLQLWVNGRAHKVSSRQWRPAREVSAGDSIGLLFTFDRVLVYQNRTLKLELHMDNEEAAMFRRCMGREWWAVVDVLGKVSGVKLNGDDAVPPE